MLQSLFKSETTIIERKSYLVDTRKPNFVEMNKLPKRMSDNQKTAIGNP